MNIFINALKVINRIAIVVDFAALCFFGYFVYFVIKRIVKKERNNIFSDFVEKTIKSTLGTRAISIIVIIVTIPSLLLLNSAFQDIIGLHNLYLENDGRYCYSVVLHEYDSHEDYTVPAEIEVDEDKWYLIKVVRPNGEIYDYDCLDCEIDLQSKVYIYDEDYIDIGYVNLLNEHTISSQIKETQRTDFFSVFGLIITIVCVPFTLIVLTRRVKDPDD